MVIELQIEASSSFRIICKSLELRHLYKQLIRVTNKTWGVEEKEIPSVSGEFLHKNLIILLKIVTLISCKLLSTLSVLSIISSQLRLKGK